MAGKTIKRAIKNATKWAAFCAGSLDKKEPPATRILTYHSIGYRKHEMNVTPEDFREQIAWLGDSTSLEFTFSAPSGFSGAGAILYSQSLEELVPDDDQGAAPADGDDLAAEPTLSDAEMTDILSGFGPETGGVPGIVGQQSPTNIEMVLGSNSKPPYDSDASKCLFQKSSISAPVLLINGKLIARGDVVVVDEKFGL
jgi:hypothetical protein